jgi:DNA-binding winged helix-turn-helix (wHTH) protein
MAADFHSGGQSWHANGRFLSRGPFIVDLVNRQVTVDHKPIELPSCAFECLVLLVQKAPEPVSFQDLAQASPGLHLSKIDVQDKARLHIYILKKAFEQNQASSCRIKAVPGYGYWLNTN